MAAAVYDTAEQFHHRICTISLKNAIEIFQKY